MGMDKEQLFADLGAEPNRKLLYALAVLNNLAYLPDSNKDDRWASFFGFADSQVVVTPGNTLPNYCRVRSQGHCIFAIEGTTNVAQAMQYILYSGQRINNQFGPQGAHSMFLWMAESLIPLIQADLAAIPAGAKLLFTGHSLGAAIAYLLACWFSKNSGYEVANYVGFCSPRVGSHAFCILPRTFRSYDIYNYLDLVQNCPTYFCFTLNSLGGGDVFPFLHRWDHQPNGWMLHPDGTLEF